MNLDFSEVAKGLTEEEAKAAAARCLNCKNKPCVSGCPVGIDIPAFLAAVKEGDMRKGFDIISKDSALPAVCGRVCPQENQCEKLCVRGLKVEPVSIGRVERYLGDLFIDEAPTPPEKRLPLSVGIVGSGPAGLTCAGELARAGAEVTVYEALHAPGGVLSYGIPEFRLPKSIVKSEVDKLKQLGVNIACNVVVGKTVTMAELQNKHDAVFLGTGAGLPQFLGIPGEALVGVYSANEFLTRINLMKAYLPESHTPISVGRRVAVVGGGNVAMDAARCALRMGAEEVMIIYRRSMEELPARLEEVRHAEEEGVVFNLLRNPTRILGEGGRVTGMECIRMMLGEPDASGRRSPVPEPGSEFTFPLDTVVIAIGNNPNPILAASTEGLETDRRGRITADDVGATSLPGVFAGGDAVTGAATVILAMGAGKKAAQAILADYE